MMNSIIKKNYSFTILGVLFILLMWVVFGIIVNNDIILPKIDNVLKKLWVLLSKYRTYIIIFNTLSRLLFTIFISFIISVLLGTLSIISTRIRSFLLPIVTIIKTLPVATIIIILLIIFGGSKSPLIITGFVVFPLIYESIVTSFKTIDKSLIDDILTISNINFNVIKDVFIPIGTPFILTSIISSIGLGLKVMVMAEFIAQPNNTIGKEILYSKEMLQMENVFAWTLILIVFVMIIEILVKKVRIFNY